MTSGITLKKVLISALALLVFVSLAASPIFAQNVNAPKNEEDSQITLEVDEVVDEDYFAAGDTVTISGTVNGDVYAAGGNIYVDGTINGDLLTAGGNVTISGTVSEDIRTAGGNVTISGETGGSLTALGGNITLTDEASVGGSLVASGGTVQVYAPVAEGITLAAGQVTLANTVGGNVTAGVGEFTLAPQTQVSGDITYWSDRQANIANEATVSGEVVHNATPRHEPSVDTEKVAGLISKGLLTYKFLSLAAALITGLVLIRFAPLFTSRITSVAGTQIGKSILFGLITLIIAPILILVLMFTVIGIPLALITGALYFISLYLSKIFVGLALGQKIFDYSNKPKMAQGWALVVGLVVLYIIELIPLIGWIVWLAALALGVGAIIISKKDLYRAFRDKKLI